MVTAAMLPLVCCGYFCMKKDAVCRQNQKDLFSEKRETGRSLRVRLLPVLVFLLCAAAGVWRAREVKAEADACLAFELDGCLGRCEGRIESLAKKKDRWEAVLRLETLELDRGEPSDLARIIKRVLISIDGEENPALNVGAKIEAEGSFQAFDPARNPGQFDFQDYYRAKKLFYRMTVRQSQRLDDSYDWVGQGLFQAADYAGQILDRIADEEAAGIFRAVLLGDRTKMDTQVLSLYRRNGVAHLLAISGLHLSLISLAVYGVLRKIGLGFGGAGLVGGAALLFYAGMTGLAPSVQRAAVMALCGYLAAYLGRTYDLLSALALAAVLLLGDNPYALTQAGVQLSFAAVLGIGAAAPRLMEPQEGSAWAHPLRKTLVVSLGMQLMTTPLVLYHFFEIPLYGMILNLLVVPLMGMVVFSGAAGIFLGSFHTGAGRFAVGSGSMILALYRQLCTWFGLLPGANLVMGRPKLWQIGIYYGALTAYLLFCRSKSSGDHKPSCDSKILYSFRFIPCKTALTAACFALILLPLPKWGLEITFLDVGQGDGICMETASGVILVDGGSSDERSLFGNILEPFLKSRGITTVDYAIVSHGDQDHINGLTELFQSGRDISVSNLILPGIGQGDSVYSELAQIASEQGTHVLWMGAGDRFTLGRLSVECMYPPNLCDDTLRYGVLDGFREGSDRNAHSLVLRLSFDDFSMVLTGDMTTEGERAILDSESGIAPVHVLKVAHHGSRTSTSPAWLDALNPAWAVISCGRDNRYGHPHSEVLDALEERKIEIWMTPKSGAITLYTDGKKIRWHGFLSRQSESRSESQSGNHSESQYNRT